MLFKRFKKPNNVREDGGLEASRPTLPAGELCITCGACKKILLSLELKENRSVCPKCGHYHRLSSRERVRLIADKGSFEELFDGLSSINRLGFPGYDEKLEKAKQASGESEAVLCGTAVVEGQRTAIFVMEADFMMGSMGAVCGEKITLLFEHATKEKLPVVGFTVSGGARMQEGIVSLMQMAKTSAAAKLHSDGGNLFISMLTDPTTGGVLASFAMLGDVILAEPRALIGFAGPRVIEQTIRQKLPQGFQSAEFLLEKGFVDKIVPREQQKETIARIIRLSARNA